MEHDHVESGSDEDLLWFSMASYGLNRDDSGIMGGYINNTGDYYVITM